MKQLLNFILALALSAHAFAGQRGVIHDPDGFTNVRAKQSADSPVVARVKLGETFEFRGNERDEWWKVTLSSGKTGYMHASRIRFHATMDALADTKPEDEVNVLSRREGFDYYPVARAAAKGERAAMERFFAFQGDGAAAESHWTALNTVMHLLGDEKLAKFMGGQPADYRATLREHLSDDMVFHPFKSADYARRNFPKTAKLLWPG